MTSKFGFWVVRYWRSKFKQWLTHNLLTCFLLFLFPFGVEAKGVEAAVQYHQNSSFQWNAAMQMLHAIPWQGNERVLDIGCGDGKITAFIANAYTNGSVIGLDISSSMVQFASANFAKQTHPNLSFMEGSADALPFEEQFDVVVSFSALHWVLDQEKALRDIVKSLSSGGKCYIATIGKASSNLSTQCEALIFSQKWAADFPHYKQERVYFSEEEYRSLLETIGFAHFELNQLDALTWYPDRSALYNFLKPVTTFIHHLSPEKQDLFMNELVDRMISLSNPSEDGAVPLKLSILQVIAEKH